MNGAVFTGSPDGAPNQVTVARRAGGARAIAIDIALNVVLP